MHQWLRSLPYVRAWDERYRSDGLVTIGVHTPEFSFERNLDNVRRALEQMHVAYPVAVDNDYAVWNAFANHYWPALYFVDAEGRIRHHRFGEGGYERSEIVIQKLLADAGADVACRSGLRRIRASRWRPTGPTSARRRPTSATAGPDFASPGGIAADAPKRYTAPGTLRRNQWALSGDWRMAGATS